MARITIEANSLPELDAVIKKLGAAVLSITAVVRFDDVLTIAPADLAIHDVPEQPRGAAKPTGGAKKPRKFTKRKDKPDPVKLVTEQGWVVRGPYKDKNHGIETVRLVNPKNQKEYQNYSIGRSIEANVVATLKELAKDNEKGVGPRGIHAKQAQKEAPPVKDPPVDDSKFCAICRIEGRDLGVCKSFPKRHCEKCCDSNRHEVD